MKNLVEFVFTVILSLLVSFAAVSFVVWSVDPSLWGEWVRGAFLVLFVGIMVFDSKS